MHKGICPECGKKVTVGVMNRVAQLADREKPQTNSQQFPFNSLLTLKISFPRFTMWDQIQKQ